MNILYYNLQLGSFDGSNSHAVGMLDALRQVNGTDSVRVANDVAELEYSHGQDVLRRRLGKVLDPARLLRRRMIANGHTASIIQESEAAGFVPDVILARSSIYDYVPMLAAQRLGCPLVLEYNTPFVYECCDIRKTFFRTTVRRYEEEILSRCDLIYSVSNVLAQMLMDDYGVSAARIKVIPNGYEQATYNDDATRRSEVRARTRLECGTADSFVVTFLGSLQTWHGIPHLLELAEAYRERSDVEFWIVGDGILRDSVRQRAAENANVKWFGNVSAEDVRAILYASDLGIMPYSRMGRFYFSPLKMYEMVGAGLPFIATDIGQISEFCVESLDPCFLFKEPSVDLMSASLDAILGDPTQLERMRLRVQRVAPSCTWLARARNLTSWIEAQLSGSERGPK